MITEGIVIPREVIRAMEVEIKSGSFSYSSVMTACHRALKQMGINDHISARTADKYLQQERKAGRINFSNGKWSLVK